MGKYWDNICEMQKRQTEKGIKKYGFTLEDNKDLTDIQRIEYLQEELIDGLMYCEHLKEMLRGKKESKKEEIKVCNYCFFREACCLVNGYWDSTKESCVFRFALDKKTMPGDPKEALEVIEKLHNVGAMI